VTLAKRRQAWRFLAGEVDVRVFAAEDAPLWVVELRSPAFRVGPAWEMPATHIGTFDIPMDVARTPERAARIALYEAEREEDVSPVDAMAHLLHFPEGAHLNAFEPKVVRGTRSHDSSYPLDAGEARAFLIGMEAFLRGRRPAAQHFRLGAHFVQGYALARRLTAEKNHAVLASTLTALRGIVGTSTNDARSERPQALVAQRVPREPRVRRFHGVRQRSVKDLIERFVQLDRPMECGNVRTDGKTLFSYGVPIAVKRVTSYDVVSGNKEGEVWIENRHYSATTTRHVRMLVLAFEKEGWVVGFNNLGPPPRR
jgi:hypothetical protein